MPLPQSGSYGVPAFAPITASGGFAPSAARIAPDPNEIGGPSGPRWDVAVRDLGA